MKPVILLGGGGHAGVLRDALQLSGLRIAGLLAPARLETPTVLDLSWLGGDELLNQLPRDKYRLVVAVGSSRNTTNRRDIFQRAREAGFEFQDVVHPSAVRSELYARAGAGLQLLAGAVVGPGVTLGDNVLINTRAVIEHDCHIGSHTHVASGAVLCGSCHLGEAVHVGAGAVLRQGIRVGDGACIAAGAVVIRDVEAGTVVAGVPASDKKKTPS